MEDTIQDFMNLWDAADPSQLTVADPTKAFLNTVKTDIQKQTGMTNNAAKVDPKATLNKAITKAAQDNPVAASDALNATNKKTTMQMKKENKFLTLAQWREACGCGTGAGAGTPENKDHIDGSWQGAAGGGKLSSVGAVNMKKKSSKK
jgi:erythromycin esterase-like protein